MCIKALCVCPTEAAAIVTGARLPQPNLEAAVADLPLHRHGDGREQRAQEAQAEANAQNVSHALWIPRGGHSRTEASCSTRVANGTALVD